MLDLLAEVIGDYPETPLWEVVDHLRAARASKPTLFFIGNGGSAAIASHMAVDYMKNGRFRALCFNDGAQLTCVANDLGYGNVFAEPILMHGREGDVLFAISSSGKSDSILNGVHAARIHNMKVVTLSGMKPDNPLRAMGDINFHVASDRYGVVEIAHLAILHAILDTVMDEQAT